jgi:hypothetical protein
VRGPSASFLFRTEPRPEADVVPPDVVPKREVSGRGLLPARAGWGELPMKPGDRGHQGTRAPGHRWQRGHLRKQRRTRGGRRKDRAGALEEGRTLGSGPVGETCRYRAPARRVRVRGSLWFREKLATENGFRRQLARKSFRKMSALLSNLQSDAHDTCRSAGFSARPDGDRDEGLPESSEWRAESRWLAAVRADAEERARDVSSERSSRDAESYGA